MSPPNLKNVRYLLMQIRDQTDPMREQEIGCFAWALECDPNQIQVHDLLLGGPQDGVLNRHQVVLIGGSGDYSTTKDAVWLDRALDCLRDLHARRKPVFGSCWGFQAITKALGGKVINDVPNAELGTIDVTLTEQGQQDPVFGPLPSRFTVLMGHEDVVTELPPGAELLASSATVTNQAFRMTDAPCYATQFHPELHRETFLDRIRTYKQYVTRILEKSFEEFEAECREVPSTSQILKNFVKEIL